MSATTTTKTLQKNNPMNRLCPHCKKNDVTKGSYCTDCARILTIQRQQKFKTACVLHICQESNTEYGTCSGCGERFSDAQLCIRHRESAPTNVKISKLTGSVPLKERVIDELDKCDLLCHNCERGKYRSKRPPTALKKKALAHLGGECKTCGCDGPPSALEFHHEDATKKTLQLGDRGLKSWDNISGDLAVCSIKCANCHSLGHAQEKANERNSYRASVGLGPEPVPGESESQHECDSSPKPSQLPDQPS